MARDTKTWLSRYLQAEKPFDNQLQSPAQPHPTTLLWTPQSQKSPFPTYKMHMTAAACCIFMLFFLLRMLSEDWYTWMLQEKSKA